MIYPIKERCYNIEHHHHQLFLSSRRLIRSVFCCLLLTLFLSLTRMMTREWPVKLISYLKNNKLGKICKSLYAGGECLFYFCNLLQLTCTMIFANQFLRAIETIYGCSLIMPLNGRQFSHEALGRCIFICM